MIFVFVSHGARQALDYAGLARYEELADPKYTHTGRIFDIMAMTVIQTHLGSLA